MYNLFWIDTPPQHFPDTFGDFRTTIKYANPNGTLLCEIPKKRRDWRNELFAKNEGMNFYLKSKNRTIEIAKDLYSQWDAHKDNGDGIGGHLRVADCTHWCIEGGVFQYIVSKLVTAISTTAIL
jgi:hypothetical protein